MSAPGNDDGNDPNTPSQPTERGSGTGRGPDPIDKEADTIGFRTSPEAEPTKALKAGQAAFETIGHYDILRELGRGGMGVVFEARHRQLNRTVALKMIASGKLATVDEVLQFQREAEAVAALDHPGIVSLYEVGEHQGQHFFTMSLVEGESLADTMRNGPLPPRRAAELIREVAEAADFAHRQGIIHRDLKPSNILLDSDGRARLTDFGLAKQFGLDQGQTQSGQIVGTPSFMAPEQASGRLAAVGPATDIYALGSMLYAMLVGRPPFQADNPVDTLVQVIEQPPPAPRLLNPQVPVDLESICFKCLAKDPGDRYPSAAALAEDLQRFLDGDPVSAKSLNWVERVVRTLNVSRNDAEMQAWSAVLFWFAAIVMLAELAIMWHKRGGPPYVWQEALAIRFVEYLSMIGVLVAYRRRWATAMGHARRQVLAIWIGFVLCCNVLLVVMMLSDGWRRPLETMHIYPQFSIVSGMAFFVMGSLYWGRCYLMAAAFLVSAPLMNLAIDWTPLWFGGLWSICLIAFGVRLRRGIMD